VALSRLHSLHPTTLIAILDTYGRWHAVAAFLRASLGGSELPLVDPTSVLLSTTVRDASELVPLSVNAFLLFLTSHELSFP
jgi:hypothetical protein